MSSADLRSKFGPIEQQGTPNSCAAHAATSVVEAVLGISDLSRLFVYWNGRSYTGQTGRDAGLQPRNAMKGIAQYGAPAEAIWSYDISKLTVKPDSTSYNLAQPLRTRIKAYQSVQTLTALKTALTQGLPVLFAFIVPDTFLSVTKYSGVQPDIAATANWIGGHVMVAVGFDDVSRQVLVRNSFGPTWGRGGYCQIGYEWFANMTTGKVQDAWTIIPA